MNTNPSFSHIVHNIALIVGVVGCIFLSSVYLSNDEVDGLIHLIFLFLFTFAFSYASVWVFVISVMVLFYILVGSFIILAILISVGIVLTVIAALFTAIP